MLSRMVHRAVRLLKRRRDRLLSRSAPVLGRSNVQPPTNSGKCRHAGITGACCARGRGHSGVVHSTALAATCVAVLGCVLEGRLPAQSWTNTSLSASQRADALLAAMSQSDKIALVQGAGGPYVGNIATNQNLKIPTLGLEDGPAGIGDGANNVTAFPAPITLAASWD